MPVTPWAADSLSHVQNAPVIQPIWRVSFPGMTSGQGIDATDVPAWDITVALDGSRNPYGTASLKIPARYGMELWLDSFGCPFRALQPYRIAPVVIRAGYQRGATADLQVLFTGFITRRQWHRGPDGEEYVQIDAETAEACYDFPLNRVQNVGNTWSTIVGDAMATINAYSTPWYRTLWGLEESGRMNTPTSAQLTAWRAMQGQIGDSAMDTLATWATTLGQWIRGHARNPSPANSTLLVSADPYPYREVSYLPKTMFSELDRVEDVGQWANVVNFTAQWTDSGGDGKSKKAVYVGSGVGGAGQVRAKDVTVQVYPPSGALPASYALAQAWVRRCGPLSEIKFTASSRAMFWLQPRIDGVLVVEAPDDIFDNYGDNPAGIDSITFNVDQGTQTMSWLADNDFIGT